MRAASVSAAALLAAAASAPQALAQQCVGGSYGYGSGACSLCAAGSSLVSASAGCAPLASLPGPADTAFYLSGTEAEGVAAFVLTGTAPTYVADHFGTAKGALAISSGSYLTAGSATGLLSALPQGSTTYSATAWVLCAASGQSTLPSAVLAFGTPMFQDAVALGVAGTGASTMWPGGYSAFHACDASWHHLAVTMGGGTATYYLDGVSVASRVPQSPSLSFSGSPSLSIGWSGDPTMNGGSVFSGALSDLRVYSRALASAEVALFLAAPCQGENAYGYGSGCANCSAEANLLSASAGCAPKLPLNSSDTAFYLSGSSAEGVAALSLTGAAPSFVADHAGTSNGALALASGSYLTVSGAGAPPLLPASGSAAFSASAWVKCAAPATYAASIEWGAAGDAGAGASATALALVVGGGAAAPLANSGVVTLLAGSGTGAPLSGAFADGAAAAASFNKPYAVTVIASSGVVAVADAQNNCIRLVTPLGVVTTLAGSSGGSGYVDGAGTNAQFYRPVGVASLSESLVVADNYNHRIRIVRISGGVTSTLAGSGAAAFADGTGVAAKFRSPTGVAVDTSNLIVVVADTLNNRIRVVTWPQGIVTTLAGSSASGSSDGTGTSASFNSPQGVAVIPASAGAVAAVVVADTGNHLVRLVTLNTGVVTTLAGSGTSAFTDGVGAAASFLGPFGVAFSPLGAIIVADSAVRFLTCATSPSFAGCAAAAVTVVTLAPGDTMTGVPLAYVTSVGVLPAKSTVVTCDYNLNTISIMTVPFSLVLPACDSAWHHVALSYSSLSSPPSLSAFLDGALLLTQAAATPITLPTHASSSLRIGWSGDLNINGGSLFSGALSDLRIYARALGANEVAQLAGASAASLPAAPTPPPAAGSISLAVVAGAAAGAAALLLAAGVALRAAVLRRRRRDKVTPDGADHEAERDSGDDGEGSAAALGGAASALEALAPIAPLAGAALVAIAALLRQVQSMIASAREAGALAARLERLRSLTRRAGEDAAFVEEHAAIFSGLVATLKRAERALVQVNERSRLASFVMSASDLQRVAAIDRALTMHVAELAAALQAETLTAVRGLHAAASAREANASRDLGLAIAGALQASPRAQAPAEAAAPVALPPFSFTFKLEDLLFDPPLAQQLPTAARGSFGVVVFATWRAHSVPCAVKLISARSATGVPGVSMGAWLAESELMRRLREHRSPASGLVRWRAQRRVRPHGSASRLCNRASPLTPRSRSLVLARSRSTPPPPPPLPPVRRPHSASSIFSASAPSRTPRARRTSTSSSWRGSTGPSAAYSTPTSRGGASRRSSRRCSGYSTRRRAWLSATKRRSCTAT